MIDKREFSEAEKLLQIQKSIIHTLKSRKNVEKDYLNTILQLLDYWNNKLDKAGSQSNKDEILETIKSEEATIKKIKEDIKSIDELIEKAEKNLKKK